MSSATLADRFLSTWKRLEGTLVERWRAAHPGRRESDIAAVLAWSEREHLVGGEAADFLQSCRAARNAYAHVCFDGYDGPVTHPPAEVVHRLERILAALRTPARLTSIAHSAVICTQQCSVLDALAQMRKHDFSQLPYEHATAGWTLVTREQVARWLEVQADAEGTVLADLTVPVSALADHPEVGPVVPRTVASDATLLDAVRELEQALHTPDSQPGGYATVLVHSPHSDTTAGPRLLASDDLPRLYGLLGR